MHDENTMPVGLSDAHINNETSDGKRQTREETGTYRVPDPKPAEICGAEIWLPGMSWCHRSCAVERKGFRISDALHMWSMMLPGMLSYTERSIASLNRITGEYTAASCAIKALEGKEK